MSDKLDDRYVEYDLDNSINILDAGHGGTGTSNINEEGGFNAGQRILISHPTGFPAPDDLKILSSGWSPDYLNSLAAYDPNKGPFENRITNTETHVSDTDIHVPLNGLNTTFLRGDNTWQPISGDAENVYVSGSYDNSLSGNVEDILQDFDNAISAADKDAAEVICIDVSHYSNELNVQGVLNDLDQAIFNNIPVNDAIGSSWLTSGVGGYRDHAFSINLPAGTWRVALSLGGTTGDLSTGGINDSSLIVQINGSNVSSNTVRTGYGFSVFGYGDYSGTISVNLSAAVDTEVTYSHYLLTATRIA